MHKIKIGRKQYRIPAHWDELTLAQCAWLQICVNESAESVQAYFRSFASEEPPPSPPAELLPFCIDILSHMAHIPRGVLEQTCPEQVLDLSVAALPRFVCAMMGAVDYTPSAARGFWWRGRRYRYPELGRDVLGAPTPLSGLSAIELTQLSDVVLAGNMELAPLAVALCCRPRGEAFDEARAQRRVGRWRNLPASVYWDIRTKVSAAHEYLQGSFPECYGKGGEGEATGKPPMWCDMLVAMAVGSPADLNSLQRMNGYDFVHLLNEEIKHKTEQWKINAALSGLRLG